VDHPNNQKMRLALLYTLLFFHYLSFLTLALTKILSQTCRDPLETWSKKSTTASTVGRWAVDSSTK